MFKNALTLFLVSYISFAVSCAPKRIAVPSFEGKDIQDALSELSGITQIETTFSIVFEKTDTEITGDGALTISRNGDLDLRVYSLGFLAMELTSQNGRIKSNPLLDRYKKIILTQGLQHSLFWWDTEEHAITEEDIGYRLASLDRVVWISKQTLLPQKQKIYFSDGRELTVYYDNPVKEQNIWYQSKMRIEFSRYAVTLLVKKISFSS
jgi:hypothetical protein